MRLLLRLTLMPVFVAVGVLVRMAVLEVSMLMVVFVIVGVLVFVRHTAST